MPQGVEFPTTCYIYAGFTSTERTGNPRKCRLVEQLDEGRRPESSGLAWSHYIELELAADIRDGITRSSNTLVWSDGDKVIIPDASGTVYVTVFVIVLGLGSKWAYKRAYLMRDDANFTGTGWS